MYAWSDDWYMKDPVQADTFFEGLKSKLASEGFVLSEPATSFVASGGQQPTGNDQVYWFKGSYQGSPQFQIKLVRSGPHLEGFHLMYEWEIMAYSSPNKEMEERTHSLHESLRDWVKKGGIANLPPKSN
jgi:hypothetical protein